MNPGPLMRLLAAKNVLSVFLLLIPLALALEYLWHAGALAVFTCSALAIVPLAGWMGRATEHLARHLGAGPGGFLNAAFGNAAEAIIGAMALREGLYDLVKASITGSIIGNILLVFGLSAFLGGIRYKTLRFNRTAAGHGSTMLLLSAIALLIPAIFHTIAGEDAPVSEQRLGLLIAAVLLATYAASLFFSFKTHSHLYVGAAGEGPERVDHEPVWSRRRSLAVLLAAAALVAVMSELLVGSAEAAAHVVGMSEVFVGVILVALIGNAAEHSTAVLMALNGKMDLSINIAVGSSMQIALFVAPLMVFLSYVIGPRPMDLRFTTMEVVTVGVSVGIMAALSQDGETHWMEGIQLLAVYAIVGITFFFLPT